MDIINIISTTLSNKIILGAFFATAVAQFLKVIFMGIKNKKLDLTYAFSMSGMPSGHSSGIVSLATLIGLKSGFDSVIFAFAACMAIVIMYDAIGVRQQAGKHAETLNYLLDKYTIYANEEEDAKHYLKVRLGHNEKEVAAGFLNGVLCATLFNYFIGV